MPTSRSSITSRSFARARIKSRNDYVTELIRRAPALANTEIAKLKDLSIANSREQPIETNEYQSVDGTEGEFLWSSPPQDVYLLPQRPNLCLERCPRPEQIDDHPTNKSAKIPHPTTGLPDSRSTASQMRFATGTTPATDPCEILHLLQRMASSCFARKGCAGQPPGRALRGHRRPCDPRRIASPIRTNLVFGSDRRENL